VARKNDSKVKARLFGAPVKLADAAPAADGPVWIHVATEGRWEGHPNGGVVEFSRKSFEQIIANFRKNPWYSPGPDGVGSQRVIPYDYEHASEMHPTEGSIPETGAPAPAWATELQLRDGEEGKAQLWALTLLSTQAREQIREGGYLSTSVAVWPNAKDAVTNKPIGALLTSIAFTNHPFIKGMAPIAASMSVWGKAESSEEALVGLRDLLGLPADAAPAEVAVELETLRQAVANGMTSASFPDGFGSLVDSVRRLLGLRVLASTDEILNTAGQLIVAVADTNAPPQQAPEDNTMTAPAAPAPALATALLGKLADLFNCRDSEPVLLAAAEKAKVKGDTLDQLLGLFESDDMTALLGDAAKTIEKAKKADEYLAGLTAVRERLGAADKKEAEAEVEQIAASMGLSGDNLARFKPLLLSARVACNVDDPKERETKLAAFYTQYPLPKVDPAKALLTQTVVAGQNGVQLLGGAPLPATPTLTGSVVPSAAPGGTPQHMQLLAAYPGRNEIEKACAYHSDKTPGFKTLPRQTQIRAASGFVRTGQLAL
jgi:Mu-like prophage I protein